MTSESWRAHCELNMPERFTIRRRQGYGGTSVMARGNQGLKIFVDEGERSMWLATLREAWRRALGRIHAWLLINNHQLKIMHDGL